MSGTTHGEDEKSSPPPPSGPARIGESEQGTDDNAPAPVALVTGGTSGIGAATARHLIRLGWRLAVTGRSTERLDAFARETEADDTNLLTIAARPSEWDDVVAAVDLTLARFGRLDAAIANAGFTVPGGLQGGDPTQWKDMVLVNVLGPALLAKATQQALAESRGRLVLIGSIAGQKFAPGSLYSATKFAVTAMAENYRMVLLHDGIKVTLIAPGAVETDFWASGTPRAEALLDPQVIAEGIGWVLSQPEQVNPSTLVLRPSYQSF
ncbi:SDR family oxidoreductase [soil metagenome]